MRLTAAEIESQKERIVESARNVFIQDGYTSAKMEDIAKGAGISRSPLYYHFTNKQELFNVVFYSCCDELERREQEIYNKDVSIFDRIYQGLMAAVQVADDDLESLRPALISSKEELAESYKRYIEMRIRLKALKTEKIRVAVQKGELRADSSPELICDLIFLYYRGIVGEVQITHKGYWDEKYIHKLVTEFVSLLRAKYGIES